MFSEGEQKLIPLTARANMDLPAIPHVTVFATKPLLEPQFDKHTPTQI